MSAAEALDTKRRGSKQFQFYHANDVVQSSSCRSRNCSRSQVLFVLRVLLKQMPGVIITELDNSSEESFGTPKSDHSAEEFHETEDHLPEQQGKAWLCRVLKLCTCSLTCSTEILLANSLGYGKGTSSTC